MTLQRKTWAEVRAAVIARLGRTRKMGSCDWTPWPNVDDCSYFCSSMLYGGKPGPIGWVDNWKAAIDGTYHAGYAGMRAGDVVLFDWPPKNNVGNHVEFADGSANASGYFPTLGANGSDTIAVKARTRHVSFVMGYFRPAYTNTVTPATPSKPVVVTPTINASSEEISDMSSAAYITTKPSTKATSLGIGKGYVYFLNWNERTLRRVTSTKEITLLKRIAPVVKTSTKGVPTRAFPAIEGDTIKLLLKQGWVSETSH